jgi:lipopolysaccharide transport system permease protein
VKQEHVLKIISSPHDLQEVVLEPAGGWFSLRLKELWEYRELLYFFIWREIKVRYKQTVLGASWAVLQPVLTMVIFSVIFGRLANLDSEGIPYPIFTYAALLPWQLFSRALGDASGSLVGAQSMITKVYFPRLFLPGAAVLSGLVDFAIAFIVMLGLMLFYGITPTLAILTLPLFLLLAIVTALAVGMWLSALNVKYRDIKYVTPFLIQLWLYGTPIAYSATLIPEQYRILYGLNPMAGVVNGFRWALLGQDASLDPLLIPSVIMVLVLFITGLIYFQRTEQTFADIV